jgi:regulator of protease activity HflC (stomatin/prohibitin superfamily)
METLLNLALRSGLGSLGIIVIVLAIFILPQAIRILREYERGVIFRLGKLQGAKGPGLIFLIPIIDKMVKMDLRVVTIDVPKQEIMTKDNVPATVDAVMYFRVVDPNAAVVKVENFWKATSLIASVEVKEVSLPDSMKRAMAKQAEAERERRAKVVNAEGEFQAAEKMVQAAALIAKEPIALQLRYLQTMREMASEHNTTTFLPLPIDLFSAFLKK